MSTLKDIPEVHTKETLDDGNILYRVVCAYCGEEVEFRHSSKPGKCPHCGATDYRKPKTETHLFELQRQYKQSGNTEPLSRMYTVLCGYARSIVKKHLPKDFTYHYEGIEEKASDAANLLIEQYLAKPEFEVRNSFGGYLQWKVKQVLWDKKTQREEDHESLNARMEGDDDNANAELADIAGQLDAYSVFETEESKDVGSSHQDVELTRDDINRGIYEIIEHSLTQIEEEYSKALKLLVMGALFVSIQYGLDESAMQSNQLNRYYHQFGTHIKNHLDGIVLLIYRFLKEEY